MRRRAVVLVFAVFALALAACLPPPPPPPAPTLPAGKPAPNPATPAQGFDACAAPSLSTMSAWWASSPYTSAAIYIGGVNRGCPFQPNLTANWVNTTTGAGWKLIPIWVGPQAPCTTLSSTKLSADPAATFAVGVSQADLAANAAIGVNVTHGPIYFDMEAYPRGNPCSLAVQNFANGWVQQLHARGFLGAFYSSLCSGILDLSASVGGLGVTSQDGIWIAAYPYNADDARYATYVPNLFGFSECITGVPSTKLSDAQWTNHQRVRQFRGGHNETWGGALVNIDTNAVDGLTYP